MQNTQVDDVGAAANAIFTRMQADTFHFKMNTKVQS